jgi:aspartate kinase
MQVFKFGGASVKDAASVKNVLSILKKNSSNIPTLMVLSAMGKTTNLLEELASAYFKKEKNSVKNLFRLFREQHENIRKALYEDTPEKAVPNADWMEFIEEFQWELENPPVKHFDFHYDQIVSKGELASTLIVSEFLHHNTFEHALVDARDLLITDDTWREANVDYVRSEEKIKKICIPLLKEKGFILTQGFIGSTTENYTTTLGREGSDYSAALFSYFLDAEKMVVWKDVPGILNADPRYFKNPKRIPELSYYDAIEMTYYGASVIHPKTIRPLQNKKIPLHVRSFIEPETIGTIISEDYLKHKTTTYIYKANQILISVQPYDFSFVTETALGFFFKTAAENHVKIHLMHNSALNFSICTDFKEDRIMDFMEQLKKNFRVSYNTGVGLLTVRNYPQNMSMEELTGRKNVLLELKTRNTIQMVIEE